MRNILKRAGAQFAQRNQLPTSNNFLETLDTMLQEAASSQERVDVQSARDYVATAYKKGNLESCIVIWSRITASFCPIVKTDSECVETL